MLIHSNCLWPLTQQQSFRGQYNREYVFFFLQMLTDSLATTFLKQFSVPYHSFRTWLHQEILLQTKSQHYIQSFQTHGSCIYFSCCRWKLFKHMYPFFHGPRIYIFFMFSLKTYKHMVSPSLDRAYLFSDRERSPPGQNCIAAVVSVCWGIVGKSQSYKIRC